MNVANETRRLLINIGKMLPFIMCAIVLLSYLESVYAIYTHDYLVYDDYITLRKPISYYIGSIFEYDWVTVFVLLVTSFAVETCFWNKLSVIYLAAQLIFRSYTINVEFDEITVIYLCTINIIITVILIWKGIKRL